MYIKTLIYTRILSFSKVMFYQVLMIGRVLVLVKMLSDLDAFVARWSRCLCPIDLYRASPR